MNTAIPLGVQGVKIPDPLEALGKAMTLRQLIGQQELQGLQLRQARRETDKADRLDALARKGLSMDEYLRGMREIDPLAAETAGMKWRTDRRAEVKSQLELAKQRLEFNGQLLGSLASAPPEQVPALYASARRKAIEFGTLQADDPEYPEQWTPEIMRFIQRDLTANLTAKERLDRLDDAAIDRFLAEQQAQEGMEHAQNRQPAYSEDSIRAALAMGDGPTVEAANVLRAHGKPFEGSSDEQFRATRKGTTEDITPDGKRPPEYADADKLRRKASNLERQAQQLLSMRGGEKDAAELRQMAAQYRTEANRLDERTFKERERRKPVAGAPGITFDDAVGTYFEDGKEVPASRVQAVSNANRKAGASMLAGGDIVLGKTAQNKVDEGLLDTTNRLMLLSSIESQFKPEFQRYSTRFANRWASIKSKAGVGLDAAEKRNLEEFSAFKRQAIANLNDYINQVTGAAMSEQEVPRIKAGMPDPGQGLFDGDSPEEFQAKLNDTIKQLRMAEARLVYIKRNGMSLNDVPLDRVPRIMLNREDELFEQVRRDYPKQKDQWRAIVKRQLAQEFGLTAD